MHLINDRWSHRQKRQVNKAVRRLYTFRTSVLQQYFWRDHKSISRKSLVQAAIVRDPQTPCCAQNFQRTNHQFIFVILLIVDILSSSPCDCIARFIKRAIRRFLLKYLFIQPAILNSHITNNLATYYLYNIRKRPKIRFWCMLRNSSWKYQTDRDCFAISTLRYSLSF